MKKIFVFLLLLIIFSTAVFASTDKTSEEYLTSKKHLAITNAVVENVVEKSIKRALKKEAPGKYKVKFTGYTLASMKKGIFKYLEITGKKVKTNEIPIPYFNIKTLTNYNWIDYEQEPIVYKTNIIFDCEVHLSEDSINEALKNEEYMKVLRKVNKIAYPMFTLNKAEVRIKQNKLYIIISYTLPLSPKSKERKFVVSSGLNVVNGEIKTNNINFDSAYGNLPLYKVTNLINLLNPLNFAVKLIDNKKCNIRVENVKIEDDIIRINGKIYIKGEK